MKFPFKREQLTEQGKFARALGFKDEHDFVRLIASVNMRSREARAEFEQWKESDGSKRGLMRIARKYPDPGDEEKWNAAVTKLRAAIEAGKPETISTEGLTERMVKSLLSKAEAAGWEATARSKEWLGIKPGKAEK